MTKQCLRLEVYIALSLGKNVNTNLQREARAVRAQINFRKMEIRYCATTFDRWIDLWRSTSTTYALLLVEINAEVRYCSQSSSELIG